MFQMMKYMELFKRLGLSSVSVRLIKPRGSAFEVCGAGCLKKKN